MKKLASLLSALSMALVLSGASAEPQRTVTSARLTLGDVVDTRDPAVADLDLGPAPPPGTSRLFSREEILRLLASRGVSARGVAVPSSVRVKSAGQRYSSIELQQMVEPHVRAALPRGVTLTGLRTTRTLLASPNLEVGEVRVPRLVRRAGALTVTASVDLTHDGEVAQRLPVTLELELDRAAAAPVMRKGARVDLVIARGPARISAAAIALDDAELGEVRSFKVSSTNKVLRARVESSTLAVVVTP